MTEKVRPRIIPTPKQREAIRAIKGGTRYILTGGAISTAKSYGLAQIFISRDCPRFC
nr:hypothetical protein GCM10017547_38720 [Pseudarthrobacter oxydans]